MIVVAVPQGSQSLLVNSAAMKGEGCTRYIFPAFGPGFRFEHGRVFHVLGALPLFLDTAMETVVALEAHLGSKEMVILTVQGNMRDLIVEWRYNPWFSSVRLVSRVTSWTPSFQKQ